MADTDNVQSLTGNGGDLGYAQALKYGRDLASLYIQEKAKRRELELANQKLQAVLETAPNGLAVLDETMTIVETNASKRGLVEQEEGCIGRSLTEVLPSEDLAATLEIASREGTRFTEVEVVLGKPMNRTLHLVGAPLAAGDYRGWVVSLHDLTERKRLEGLKEEFINIAAHELRTPLAIILGYASILREDMGDSDDALAVTSVEAVVQAASRLKMVINELVDFAASRDRSANNMGADHFDLWGVIQHVTNSIAHQTNYKNVEILVHATDQPLIVSGDRVILAQSIGHLLENAVKFNRPDGQVHVRAAQVNGETILEIEDTGIGIPHTNLDKIFDMFYQVEEHMTRAEGGLGMGLSIAKRGVELHGGQITVRSTLGQGSCFRVTLPPPGEQMPIPPETRLDTAHQQTLAYGHDLARAFAAQQVLARRLRYMSDLGKELLARLEQLTPPGAKEETARVLDEARALARKLVDDAT